MKENELRTSLILCLVNALLGNISSHVRAICLDWQANDWIKLKFYLDIDPDEVEKELVSLTWTYFETNLNTENIHFNQYLDDIVFSNDPFDQLDHLKVVIFWRSEMPVF